LINKAPYFKYLINIEKPEESKFVYRNINNTTGEYFYEDIVITGSGSNPTVSEVRTKYREFLVSAYNKALNYDKTTEGSKDENEPEFVEDFFLMFGSVIFDEETNEKFSYATTINQNDQSHTPTINGFDSNSSQVKILDSNGNNLLHLVDSI
jgi:hypothetical protein